MDRKAKREREREVEQGNAGKLFFHKRKSLFYKRKIAL
jgi:hypothetical protein